MSSKKYQLQKAVDQKNKINSGRITFFLILDVFEKDHKLFFWYCILTINEIQVTF
jgi:hypothetical protein